MAPRKTIPTFFTGATGYIGGSVLNRLLALNEDPEHGYTYEITALVRSPEKAKLISELPHCTPLIGSLSDADKIEDICSKMDLVIHTAHADHMVAAKAILKGMEKRPTPPILLHTSGTGVLVMIKDHPGEAPVPEYKIYSDLDIPLIESLKDTQPHRDVDLEIVAVGKKGHVKTHIILPCTIYGVASGIVYEKGIANPHSIQIPTLIRASLDRKQAGMVGEGLNHWPDVHIDDCADGYIVILEKALKGETATGRDGFYFLENGEHVMKDVSVEIGKAMKKLGRSSTDEVTTFSEAEIMKYFGRSPYLGTNSRCHADRSRALGWKPKKTVADFLASIEPETVALIAKDGGVFVPRPDGPVANKD
ncbi:NAD-binding protein [Hyaloraphidium curvatum]|nr:NAD-binding protein [Hyaloraphidium curvatum]